MKPMICNEKTKPGTYDHGLKHGWNTAIYKFNEFLPTEEELIACNSNNNIDGAIVQPLLNRPYIDDTVEIHDRIHKLCKKYPGKFWGLASINPHFRHEDYKKEAERCVKGLGFVALKINPQGHAIHPATEDGLFVFECAKKLNVPVIDEETFKMMIEES